MLIDLWALNSLLIGVFFVSALLHSSVGLGGGSSYTAWMVILAVPSLMIPSIALSLNVLVSSLVCIQFTRKGLMPWKILGMVLLFSMPAAYIGGSLKVNETVIHSLLLASLVFIVFRLIYFNTQNYQQKKIATPVAYISIAVLGAVLGFLAGLVGIGGGIYLVPAL
ncbi:sulfite exporter TauE/SafE family protein, partial [Porticoccaceae bacterium]|nr:sulfite exporter TauE/SafE family protein [Porticoccaceae bacterium]